MLHRLRPDTRPTRAWTHAQEHRDGDCGHLKQVILAALVGGGLLAVGEMALLPVAAHANPPCGDFHAGPWGGGQQCKSENGPGMPVWRDIDAPFFHYHGWACGKRLYVDPDVPC